MTSWYELTSSKEACVKDLKSASWVMFIMKYIAKRMQEVPLSVYLGCFILFHTVWYCFIYIYIYCFILFHASHVKTNWLWCAEVERLTLFSKRELVSFYKATLGRPWGDRTSWKHVLPRTILSVAWWSMTQAVGFTEACRCVSTQALMNQHESTWMAD